jgi:uncharacterized protein YdaU (DUF1376 family)
MSAAWFPFYVGDFLSDTLHLSSEQVGAYVLLICHYWKNGGLPKDEAQLARIARQDAMQWQCNCNALHSFFDSNWRHKRIDAELERVADVSLKRSMAAHKSWGNKDNREHASALRKHKQKQSKSYDNHNHNNIPYVQPVLDPSQRGSPGMQTISDSVSHLGRFGIVKDKP